MPDIRVTDKMNRVSRDKLRYALNERRKMI